MGVAPPPSPGEVRRQELADFLRTRRAAVRPADIGLADDGRRRRTPGLRREEVAQHAGVGISWYTWLEQGRDVSPTPQVLDALARALRLSPAERAHLFALAGVERPVGSAGYPRSAPGCPGVQHFRRDRDAGPDRRNLLLWLFGTDWSFVDSWEQTARWRHKDS